MLDASIYGNIQAPKIDPNAGASMVSNAMSLADMGMRHQQAQFQNAQNMAIRQAYQKNTGPDGSLNRVGVLADLGKLGHAQAGQGLAQQWAKQDKDMAEARTAQVEAAQKSVGFVYPGLDYVAGAPESQRKQAYAAMMGNLEKQGVDTSRMPKEYEPGMFRTMYAIASKQKPVLDEMLAQANIGHVHAETAKLMEDARGPKKEFGRLAVENQEQIKDLARMNGAKTGIKNQIDSALTILTNPQLKEDQVVAIGSQLLKTLNSTEGKDAVGAEESKRLGSLLEKKMFNLTQPGSTFGRDIPEFINQVKLTSGEIGQAIERNNSAIDKLYGRSGRQVADIDVPASAKKKLPGLLSTEAKADSVSKYRESGSKVSGDELAQYAQKHGMSLKAAKSHLVGAGYAVD